MGTTREELERLDRDTLIDRARQSGVKRPEVMTRVELIDELLRLLTPGPSEQRRVRGWFGVARDLIASVVEQGLNLPDAAALIRGGVSLSPDPSPQPPVATVTLAEIYGAQGHFDRALAILDEVLEREPDHEVAWLLRGKLERQRASPRSGAGSVRSAREKGSSEQAAGPSDPAARGGGENATRVPRSAREAPALPSPSRAARAAACPVPSVPAGDVLVLLVEEDRASAYWELSPASRERLAEGRGEGPVVRLLIVEPGITRARLEERTLPIDASVGLRTLQPFDSGVILRAALGYESAGRFRPLFVAPRAACRRGEARLVWRPRRLVDYRPLLDRAVAFRERGAALPPIE